MAWDHRTPYPDRVSVPSPGAGSDWTFTANRGGGAFIRGMVATLQTSFAAGTRFVRFAATAGNDVYFESEDVSGHLTSTARRYSAFPGSRARTFAVSGFTVDWPTDGLWIPTGCTLSSVTTAMDVGDVWLSVILDMIWFPATTPDYTISFPTSRRYSETGTDPNYGV